MSIQFNVEKQIFQKIHIVFKHYNMHIDGINKISNINYDTDYRY